MSEMTLEKAEVLSRAWNDAFVRRQGWLEHDLSDPIDSIKLFIEHLRGGAILDAGCGWARYVHRFVHPHLSYTGIDHSSEAIALARASNPGLQFEIGSIARLPFAEHTFDGIWSCCAIGSIPKKEVIAVLREHVRVLKPDGCMFMLIPYPPQGWSEEVLYTDVGGNPTIYQAHYELDEFCEYLQKAGLAVLEADIDLTRGSQHALVRIPGR